MLISIFLKPSHRKTQRDSRTTMEHEQNDFNLLRMESAEQIMFTYNLCILTANNFMPPANMFQYWCKETQCFHIQP